MKIITWNINSIRLRSDLIFKLLQEEEPDILCLQECKSQSEEMPFEKFKPYQNPKEINQIPYQSLGKSIGNQSKT